MSHLSANWSYSTTGSPSLRVWQAPPKPLQIVLMLAGRYIVLVGLAHNDAVRRGSTHWRHVSHAAGRYVARAARTRRAQLPALCRCTSLGKVALRFHQAGNEHYEH